MYRLALHEQAGSCLRRALLTRNTAKAVSYFHENHFTLPPFSPALARDFRPFKPSPAAILHICRVRQLRFWMKLADIPSHTHAFLHYFRMYCTYCLAVIKCHILVV